jgi:cell division protease FtsH
MSNETAKAIDSEIRKIVDTGYNRAKQLLMEHEKQLHLLANALLEYETLTGDEIKTLLDKGEITRDDGTVIRPAPLPAAGSSIPKTRRPKNPFGDPAPQGA